jgi:hypothetical protein
MSGHIISHSNNHSVGLINAEPSPWGIHIADKGRVNHFNSIVTFSILPVNLNGTS